MSASPSTKGGEVTQDGQGVTPEEDGTAFEMELEQETLDAAAGDAGKSRAAYVAKMEGALESTRRRRRTSEFVVLALGVVTAVLSAATSLVGEAGTASVDWSAVLKGVGAALVGILVGLGLAFSQTIISRRLQARADLQSSQLRTLERQARVLETYLETQQWFLSDALTRRPGTST